MWGWSVQPPLHSAQFISAQGLESARPQGLCRTCLSHGYPAALLSLTPPDFPGEELVLLSAVTMLL